MCDDDLLINENVIERIAPLWEKDMSVVDVLRGDFCNRWEQHFDSVLNISGQCTEVDPEKGLWGLNSPPFTFIGFT